MSWGKQTKSVSDGDEDYGEFGNTDMESSEQNGQQSLQNKNSYADLIKRAGASKLTYKGTVSGSGVSANNNQIALDIDIGKASLRGNVKFRKDRQLWKSSLIGNVASDGKFRLRASTKGYAGRGRGELLGEHLENARGNLNLSKGFKNADLDFNARRR